MFFWILNGWHFMYNTKAIVRDTYWRRQFGLWVSSRWDRYTWLRCGACPVPHSDTRSHNQPRQGWWVLCHLQRWRLSQRGLESRWGRRMNSHPRRFSPCLTKLCHLCGVDEIFTTVVLSKMLLSNLKLNLLIQTKSKTVLTECTYWKTLKKCF